MNYTVYATLVLVITTPSYAQCPSTGTTVGFPDGAIAMRTGLAVNPDGAVRSYTVGDHGYTYINNGLNLWINGVQIGCSNAGNGARCSKAFRVAEEGNFAPGTPEFCVYAMEVRPFVQGGSTTTCSKGRLVAGNGKGRILVGDSVKAATGATLQTYVSTTSLRHKKGGKNVYLDSATVPILVYPTHRSDLRGSIAWVRYGERSSFAMFGDAGPAFGEGSVALHQLLRSGQLFTQAVGPIPQASRCTSFETSVRAPFVVRPDIKGDLCAHGSAKGAADIRAYVGLSGNVDTVVLGQIKVPINQSLVSVEVTSEFLKSTAESAGYDQARIEAMADCLSGS